jgi:hypothetical protein
MANYYKNSEVLNVPGYEIYFTRFADSIIKEHFEAGVRDLERILNEFRIFETQIIKGGGGLSKITQSLASLLVKEQWKKKKIESENQVDGNILRAESHEVDHYKAYPSGNVGLEIEWNNKDPFFDRDLENFRKLHQIGWLSVGIIVTRGVSLQAELYFVIQRFLKSIYPFDINKLKSNIVLSDNAKETIRPLIDLPKQESINKITTIIYSSKYGSATTHMLKLLLRIDRGVGNPCPLILVGIGKEQLIQDEAIL